MKIYNRCAKWLTYIYAWTIDFNGVSREEIYRTHGEEKRVFWVNSDKWPMAGQCTPFGTILLNMSKLDGASDQMVDYIFLHEVGHTKPPTLLTLGSLLIRIPLMFLVILGIPLLFVRWLIFVFSSPTIGQITTFSFGFILAALIILGPLMAISWLDEGHAELFAVSHIGEDVYQRCLQEMQEKSNHGVLMGLFRRVIYPDPRLIVWLAKRRKE